MYVVMLNVSQVTRSNCCRTVNKLLDHSPDASSGANSLNLPRTILAGLESLLMTDSEFEAFLANANEELRHKQALLLEQYSLGEYSRWFFEQATETLQFFDEADKLMIEADVVQIGSYSEKSNTWKWAWSNSSVLPRLREKVEILKELEETTGFELFGREHAFDIKDEAMAWELAAISVKHLGAIGCYRAPSSSDGPTVFLAITSAWKVGP